MGKYNAYEKYKDSGVEWLGKIPEHWDIKKLRYIGFCQNGISKSADYFGHGYPFVNYTDVYANLELPKIVNGLANSTDKDRIIYSVKKGDIFFTRTSETMEEIGIASTCLNSIDDATFSGFLIRIRPFPNLIIPEFSKYYFRCQLHRFFFVKEMNLVTRASLSQELLKKLPILLPPLPEQQAIANFLDYKTKQIDALIAKKETLLEKLDEKRTAIISHAVTKGLDPNVPMKDSGIEWLGEIPKHWELKRLKFIVSKIIDAEHKTASYDDDGDYLVVRTANVRAGKLLLENAKFTNESVYQEWTIRGVPEKGDILFTREAPPGEACLVPDKPIVCLGQRMVLFKFNKNQYDGYFLLQSLYSGIADEFIKSLSFGSTVAHFNMSDIGSIPIFIPPYDEQKNIGEYLAKKINYFDEQVKKVKTGIDLLKEYRTALITNAVTGKIDVRQVPIP